MHLGEPLSLFPSVDGRGWFIIRPSSDLKVGWTLKSTRNKSPRLQEHMKLMIPEVYTIVVRKVKCTYPRLPSQVAPFLSYLCVCSKRLGPHEDLGGGTFVLRHGLDLPLGKWWSGKVVECVYVYLVVIEMGRCSRLALIQSPVVEQCG